MNVYCALVGTKSCELRYSKSSNIKAWHEALFLSGQWLAQHHFSRYLTQSQAIVNWFGFCWEEWGTHVMYSFISINFRLVFLPQQILAIRKNAPLKTLLCPCLDFRLDSRPSPSQKTHPLWLLLHRRVRWRMIWEILLTEKMLGTIRHYLSEGEGGGGHFLRPALSYIY